jgi:hypothetical protein
LVDIVSADPEVSRSGVHLNWGTSDRGVSPASLYATKAARAVLDAAIATGRTRLWSTVGGWNIPSLRDLEKLVFERDHVTTKEDGDELVWFTRVLPLSVGAERTLQEHGRDAIE